MQRAKAAQDCRGRAGDQSAGGGRRNWAGDISTRTPLWALRMGSGSSRDFSLKRADSTFTGATVRRRLEVSFVASVRARPAGSAVACGAADSERSAQSAVATTITAITCFVRRISCIKIGQSIETAPQAVKELLLHFYCPMGIQVRHLSHGR